MRSMSEQSVSSRRSRLALVAAAVAAFALALPFSARADGNHHGKRHGNHSRSYYQDDYVDCRGPKRVKIYDYDYYPVPVPIAVPVYPAYPVSGPNAVVRIGVDWVIGF